MSGTSTRLIASCLLIMSVLNHNLAIHARFQTYRGFIGQDSGFSPGPFIYGCCFSCLPHSKNRGRPCHLQRSWKGQSCTVPGIKYIYVSFFSEALSSCNNIILHGHCKSRQRTLCSSEKWPESVD